MVRKVEISGGKQFRQVKTPRAVLRLAAASRIFLLPLLLRLLFLLRRFFRFLHSLSKLLDGEHGWRLQSVFRCQSPYRRMVQRILHSPLKNLKGIFRCSCFHPRVRPVIGWIRRGRV